MRSSTQRPVNILAIVFLVTGIFASNYVHAQDSETVRQQFRDFYEPLLPRLQASYSIVRYRCAFANPMRENIQVKYARGVIRNSEFTFDRFPTIWYRTEEFSPLTVGDKYDDDVKPEESGGWIDNYSFSVDYRAKGDELKVRHDKQLHSLSFAPYIVAPICSVKLLRTYESIMEDPDITFVDFVERNLRSGQKVKSLFFLPHGYRQALVFEVDFDPKTGVVLSSQEFDKDATLKRSSILQVKYAEGAENDKLLPPPTMILGNISFSPGMYVLKYDRVNQLAPGELSVVKYGFDESDVARPKSVTEQVTTGATNFLLVIGLVVFSLFLFFILLMVLISILARRRTESLSASEPRLPNDLSE